MKRKILKLFLVGCLLGTSLLFPGIAQAQDNEELPQPGITPDSPFYIFDNFGKNMSLFFTTNAEARTRKALGYAEERLAEARAMADKNKIREMEQATKEYDKFLNMINQRLQEKNQQNISDNLSEKIALATARHLDVLEKIKDQVPEKARQSIADAREASVDGQVNALRAIGRDKPERALDISLETMAKHLEKTKARVNSANVTDNVTGDIEEELDYAAKIAAIEDEMAALAQEKGIDITKLQQRLAQSTTNRLDVLSAVYEKVPDKAKAAIAGAIENSVKKYARDLEKLSDNKTSDISPETKSALKQIQERVKEKTQLSTSNKAPNFNNVSDNVTMKVQEKVQERVQEKVQEKTLERVPEKTSNTRTPETSASVNATRVK